LFVAFLRTPAAALSSRRVGLISLDLVKRLVPSFLVYFRNGIFLGTVRGRGDKEGRGKNYVIYIHIYS
jgi:hypothetical protein